MDLKKILAIYLVTLLPISLSAHHSHSNLDRNNTQRHTGVVSQYGWAMPHVFLKVMSPNPEGEVVEYTIEMNHPPGMRQLGWNKDTFKPCLLYTSPSPRDLSTSRMPSSA